jgi:hypothetical protein
VSSLKVSRSDSVSLSPMRAISKIFQAFHVSPDRTAPSNCMSVNAARMEIAGRALSAATIAFADRLSLSGVAGLA